MMLVLVGCVASFPDSPHVAYIILTFNLARVLFARARLKVNIIYATWGESGNEAIGCV